MRKTLLQEKGSIYIITLNVIIILTIFLFSISFTSLIRMRSLTGEITRYQAYLNAKSGLVMAKKEWKAGKLSVPCRKEYSLFDDGQYKANVSMDYAAYKKRDEAISIYPASTGGVVKITSVGKYNSMDWTITVLMEGGQQIFYYSQ